MFLTLVPAYGRDYKSKKAVLADWEANIDFLIQDVSSPWDGAYITKKELVRAMHLGKDIEGTIEVKSVNIRYKSLTQICVIKL